MSKQVLFMYFQKRNALYSFIYYDTTLGKNVRLKKSEQPSVRSDEEAERFCRAWDSKYDSMKSRIERRIQWQNHYFQFEELFELYLKVRQEEAPNSWEADSYFLKYYAFHFFLDLKKARNANFWAGYFEEFRDWLLITKPLKKKKGHQALAYATKNNIIKSLNTFLLFLHRRRLIERLEKCRYFPKSKVRRKDEEAVILEEEQRAIFQSLKNIRPEAAVFFWVSLKTGLRFSEQLGLSLADFFDSHFKTETLRNTLQPHLLYPLGYLSLDSQPKNSRKPRTETGEVLRKPLKHKKRISHEDSRVIPILDKETFNYLVGLFNRQQFQFSKGSYGENPKNYLLFETLNKNIYANALRRAQKEIKRSHFFTPHDCRHTYATWLAERTQGNFMLCRLILGHANLDITLRYTHLGAQIHKNLQVKDQVSRPMEVLA